MASGGVCNIDNQLKMFPWKEADILLLLSDCMVPSGWEPENFPLTYSFLDYLFKNCENVPGKQDDLMKNALLSLYGTRLTLPSTFKNVKRKVLKFLSKTTNNSSSIFSEFYDQENVTYLGENCNKIKLISTELAEILSGKSTFKIPGVVSNGVILELMKYKKPKFISSAEKKAEISRHKVGE